MDQITEIFKNEYSALRKRIAEDMYLRPRGIEFYEFYQTRITRLPEWLSRIIDKSIETESLDLNLILAGIDSDCARRNSPGQP